MRIVKQGRKAKPTALKKLLGNPGHRPLNKNEPIPQKISQNDFNALKPPELDELSSKWWDFLVPKMLDMGILYAIDFPVFMQLVNRLGDWERAEKQKIGPPVINQNGKLLHNLTYQVVAKAGAEALRLLSVCGLTPSDRSKLNVLDKNDQGNPWIELLEKRKKFIE